MQHKTKLVSTLALALGLAASTAVAEDKQPFESKDVDPRVIIGSIDTVGDAWTFCIMDEVPRPKNMQDMCTGFTMAYEGLAFGMAVTIIGEADLEVCKNADVDLMHSSLMDAYSKQKNWDKNYLVFTVNFMVDALACSKKPVKDNAAPQNKAPTKKKGSTISKGATAA